MFAQIVAQAPDQICILAKLLHQYLARPFKGGLNAVDTMLVADECSRHCLRLLRRIRQQGLRQRLKPCFAGHLCFRATFRLKGQVKIFQARHRFSRVNGLLQRRTQLLLSRNRLQNRGTPGFQITQIR